MSHIEDIPYNKRDPQKPAETIDSDNKEHGESDSTAGCLKLDAIIVIGSNTIRRSRNHSVEHASIKIWM